MTSEKLEDLSIRSLDVPLPSEEAIILDKALQDNPALMRYHQANKQIRASLIRQSPASFGPSFAARLTARIENTGVMIERQIFSFFKKYQLLAAGIIVGLLILNTVYADQNTMDAIFGLEDASVSTVPAEEIVSFDFNQLLNTNL